VSRGRREREAVDETRSSGIFVEMDCRIFPPRLSPCDIIKAPGLQVQILIYWGAVGATHGEADQGSPTLNRVCTDFPLYMYIRAGKVRVWMCV